LPRSACNSSSRTNARDSPVPISCPICKKPDFLPDLQKDLVAVISKYFPIDPAGIKVGLEKQGNYEVLEVNIVLPEGR